MEAKKQISGQILSTDDPTLSSIFKNMLKWIDSITHPSFYFNYSGIFNDCGTSIHQHGVIQGIKYGG